MVGWNEWKFKMHFGRSLLLNWDKDEWRCDKLAYFWRDHVIMILRELTLFSFLSVQPSVLSLTLENWLLNCCLLPVLALRFQVVGGSTFSSACDTGKLTQGLLPVLEVGGSTFSSGLNTWKLTQELLPVLVPCAAISSDWRFDLQFCLWHLKINSRTVACPRAFATISSGWRLNLQFCLWHLKINSRTVACPRACATISSGWRFNLQFWL